MLGKGVKKAWAISMREAIKRTSTDMSMDPPAVLPLDGSFHLTPVAVSDNPSDGDLREFARLLSKARGPRFRGDRRSKETVV
jgi:hypothetical protein